MDIAPKKLAVAGIIGSGSFQRGFTIQALKSDITDITFSPGNLQQVSGGQEIIPLTNVQIAPDIKSIKKGQTQDFTVSILNVTHPGHYNGQVTINYKQGTSTAQASLELSVIAAKFNAIPNQIVVRFESSFMGVGGSDNVSTSIALSEDGVLPSQAERQTVATGMSATLDPLVNSDDKSLTLTAQRVCSKSRVNWSADGSAQPYALEATFLNPQADAGKYTGIMILRSKDMGTVLSIPVEVQVRSPKWFAWLCLSVGIAISLLISWWNTKGKKINNIQSKAYRLRGKLDKADINAACRDEVLKALDALPELLEADDVEGAERSLGTAQSKMAACEESRKILQDKAAQVRELILEVEETEERTTGVVGEASPVVGQYLSGIKKELELIHTELRDQGANVESAIFDQRIGAQKRKHEQLIAVALDGFSELERRLRDLENDYRASFVNRHDDITGAFKEIFISPIKRHIADISAEADVARLELEIAEARSTLGSASQTMTALRIYQSQINNLMQREVKLDAAETTFDKALGYLTVGNISMAKDALPQIAQLIEVSIKESEGRSQEGGGDLGRDSEFAKVRRIIQGVEQGVSSNGNEGQGNEGLPLPALPSPAGEEVTASMALFLHSPPVKLRKLVNVALYIILVAVLSVLGYSQLYANNHIFGANNFWLEHLALFLWGFSIQAGTATMSDALKGLRGA